MNDVLQVARSSSPTAAQAGAVKSLYGEIFDISVAAHQQSIRLLVVLQTQRWRLPTMLILRHDFVDPAGQGGRTERRMASISRLADHLSREAITQLGTSVGLQFQCDLPRFCRTVRAGARR